MAARTEFDEKQREAQKAADEAATEADQTPDPETGLSPAQQRLARLEEYQPDIPAHMRGTHMVGEEPKHYIRDNQGKYHLANGHAPGDPNATTAPSFQSQVAAEVARQLAAMGLAVPAQDGTNAPAGEPIVVDVNVPDGMGPRVTAGDGKLAVSSLPKGVVPAEPVKAARGKAAQSD